MASTRPKFMIPMKALAVETVPDSPPGTWQGEIKYDGFRAVALVNDGKAELWSRTNRPLAFPEVVKGLEKLKKLRAVLDGEIVVLDETGKSHFQSLQDYASAQGELAYFVFDIMWLNGASLIDRPLEERRALLERALKGAPKIIQLSPIFDAEPAKLLAASKKQGLEGIILKLAGSAYEPDRRSGAWLKVKNLNEQELVIGGFTQPQGSRSHFGAILVGYYEGKELKYAGKVGTGFDTKRLAALAKQFKPLIAANSPFSNLPMTRRSRFGTGMGKAEMSKVTWLKPKLVAQIKFTEWTGEGSLRHPVFVGLREDKKASEVVRETAPRL